MFSGVDVSDGVSRFSNAVVFATVGISGSFSSITLFGTPTAIVDRLPLGLSSFVFGLSVVFCDVVDNGCDDDDDVFGDGNVFDDDDDDDDDDDVFGGLLES